MGNNLNIDLVGKDVILNPLYFKGNLYVFHCEGGFGCDPLARGNCVGGKFLIDGEDARVEGFMILRLATEEEVKNKKVSDETLQKSTEKIVEDYKELKRRANRLLSIISDIDSSQKNDEDKLLEIKNGYENFWEDKFIEKEQYY